MPFDQIIPYLIFTMVAAGTPGPSNVIVLATGSARGVVRGLPCIFGVATGMGGLMALSSFGLGAVILDQPMLQTAMKWAGAGFMLWLSWKIATAGASKPGEERPGVGFFAAVAFQAVNPKAWLIFLSASGVYLDPANGDALAQSLWLGGLFFLGTLPAILPWLALGAVMQRLIRDERSAKIFNHVMGAALAGSILFLFI